MSRLLADENVARTVVLALRADGHDVVWVREVATGAPDEEVLSKAVSESRVLLTFDKDFGELAFRRGQTSSAGIILMRPRLRSPEYLARFACAVLSQDRDWNGHFAVAEEGTIRVVPLP